MNHAYIPLTVFTSLSLMASVAEAQEPENVAPPHGTPVTGENPMPAQETERAPAAPSAYSQIGGHLGFAVPIVTFSSPTTVIGGDFVVIGTHAGDNRQAQ
jgi:hypothetical protein